MRAAILLVLLLSEFVAAEDPLARHLAALRRRLPNSSFSYTVASPFVVVGDLPRRELEEYSRNTVTWAVKHLKKDYFERDPADILDVWLFANDRSYRGHVKELTGTAPTTPFGFYSPASKGLYMNIHTGGGTLVHEIVHPFIHANFPACPPWFNEGLASLYEQCGEVGGHIHGYTNWRLSGLQDSIRAGRLGTFERLARLDEGGFYGEQRGDNYAQARYLCLYLQEQGRLRDFYHRFVAQARHDPTGLATLKAVLEVDDLGAFQRRWQDWVLELRFPSS